MNRLILKLKSIVCVINCTFPRARVCNTDSQKILVFLLFSCLRAMVGYFLQQCLSKFNCCLNYIRVSTYSLFFNSYTKAADQWRKIID